MNRFRNILLLTLAAAMVLLSVGCGESDSEAATVSSSKVSPTEETTGTETTESAPTEEASAFQTLLYDDNDIRVTAGAWSETWLGPELALLVENSSRQSILVTAQYVSVNGWMMPLSVFRAQVTGGTSSEASLSVPSTQLEQSGIETISQVCFYLQIVDGETWEEIAQSELITLDVASDTAARPTAPAGQVLYEQEGIKILSISRKEDLIADGAPMLYIENNRPEPIHVKAANVTINGNPAENTNFLGKLRSETRLMDSLTLPKLKDLKPESPNDIETIEMELTITNPDTQEEITTTDRITLTFEE